MARYGNEHKEETRRRIIESAGRRLKRDNIDGSGNAALMADAGLTNGAFYAHFASKEDLVASVVQEELRLQFVNLGMLVPGRCRGRAARSRVLVAAAPRSPRGGLSLCRIARRDRAVA